MASKDDSKPEGPAPTTRRDALLSIEQRVQAQWAQSSVYDVDIHDDALPRATDDKYFATFPYPYMNGALHLGHAFTLAKVDYQCQFQRLLGKKVLYPFGFHCTGMPIAACADKLKREIELYGNPPQFPKQDEDKDDAEDEAITTTDGNMAGQDDDAVYRMQKKAREEVAQRNKEGLTSDLLECKLNPAEAATAPVAEAAQAKIEKKRKTKAKVAKKSSKAVYQWQILAEMGVPQDEIAQFANPYHWLRYFPPLAVTDLKAFGLGTDFRRSFITTHINPYYDAFIRWQFNTLRKKQKIEFGARLSIFSPVDDQTCADHDRSEGEGVGISDYTLIKLQLLQPYPAELQAIVDALPNKDARHVYLPAATLRPETMYGQTNCFLLPEGEYGVYDMNDTSVFVCSARSALNMSYQNLTRERGKPERVGSVMGQSLMGCAVKAPLATYERVYVLPLVTIKMDKGTGVVTSVPSDAPDDYAALTDLKKKAPFREKYGIKPEHVLPFEVVPIIDIPGLGTQAAADLCIQEKVASQNDRAKLDLIKDKCYKEGFAKGVMIVGEYKGTKVSEAKPKIKQMLIDSGLALAYSEPEARVVSRSGNECVVALSDQWYLKYGESAWQTQVRDHITSGLECYNPIAKKDFLIVVDWLHHWACSRSYGLGTFLPWDTQYVIESLSDSTIYMAYYTIAHLLQGGVNHANIDGTKPGPANIAPAQLTDEVFDYIFLTGTNPTDRPTTDIPAEMLDRLRTEFQYWYPLDLRVSGKDLIGNHLTFSLYNHAAIWDNEPSKWPQSFFTNGHVTIDAKKMSKSEGTFITLSDAIKEYSADATRFALADAGDGLEDANFEKKSANAAILKLTKEIAWVEDINNGTIKAQRTGPYHFLDRVFDNELNQCVITAKDAYTQLQYRGALKASFHDLLHYRDTYRLNVDDMHRDLVGKFLRVSSILIAPICPHYAQHMWELTGSATSTNIPYIINARWPSVPAIDHLVQRQMSYLREVNQSLRKSYADQLAKLNKIKTKTVKADLKTVTSTTDTSSMSQLVIVTAAHYPQWQQSVLTKLSELYSTSNPELPPRKSVVEAVKAMHGADKKMFEQATKFAGSVLEDISARGESALELVAPFNEVNLIVDQLALVLRDIPTNAANVTVRELESVTDEPLHTQVSKALPQRPVFVFYGKDQ